MKTITSRASSPIKTLRRTREHYSKEAGGLIQACVTKRIDLTLTAQRWADLEAVTSWDPYMSVEGEIEAIVNNSKQLDDLVAVQVASAVRAGLLSAKGS